MTDQELDEKLDKLSNEQLSQLFKEADVALEETRQQFDHRSPEYAIASTGFFRLCRAIGFLRKRKKWGYWAPR